MDDFISVNDLVIAASDEAKRLVNPLRKIVDGRKMPTNPDKELLNLSVGNLIHYTVINHKVVPCLVVVFV